MTIALKDLNTFAVEKVTTETVQRPLLLGGSYAPQKAHGQSPGVFCDGCGNCSWSRGLFDKIQGRENQVMKKLFHFSREEDETWEALAHLEN